MSDLEKHEQPWTTGYKLTKITRINNSNDDNGKHDDNCYYCKGHFNMLTILAGLT